LREGQKKIWAKGGGQKENEKEKKSEKTKWKKGGEK